MRPERLLFAVVIPLMLLTLCSCGPFGIVPLIGVSAGGGGGGDDDGPIVPAPPPNPRLTLADQTDTGLTDFTNDFTVTIDVTGLSADVTHFILDESATTQPDLSDIRWQAVPIPLTYTFAGTGVKNLYLWVKNSYDFVNMGPVSRQIEIDLTLPGDPTLTLRDMTSSSPAITDDQAVDVEVTDIDADVVAYILSETQDTSPIELSADWQGSLPAVFTLSAGEGLKTVYLWVKDRAGNICTSPGVHQIIYNTAGVADPVFHLEDETNGNSAYTNATTVTLIQESIDMDATYYIVSETQSTQPLPSDSSWSSFPLPAAFDLAGTGTRLVYLWLKDDFGSINSSASSATIEVDMTDPVMASLTLRDESSTDPLYTNDPLITVETSGIDTDVTHFMLSESQTTPPAEDDPLWTAVPIWSQYTLTTGDGSKTVYFWQKDQAGNMLGQTYVIELDTQVNIPVFWMEDQDTGDWAWCDDMTVDVATGSLDSDLVEYILSETVTTTPPLTSPAWSAMLPATYTFSNGTQGDKTVYLWVKDDAENVTGTSEFITYDITDPTGTASLDSGTYTATQQVTMTGTDNLDSGPAIYYTLDGSTPDTTALLYSAEIDIPSDTTLKFIVIDAAGNRSGIYQRDYDINFTPVIIISTPGGTPRLEIQLGCDLQDDELPTLDVTVTCSADGGISWNAATIISTTAGTTTGTNVIQDVPPGSWSFTWKSHFDYVAIMAVNNSVKVRVEVFDGVSTGWDQTLDFTVDNRFIYVPDDYPTIQDGIDNSVNGQAVIVRDGTYSGPGNRNIDFRGRAILLTSENGPENCIIDCKADVGDQARAFYFHNFEGSASVVQGFTIQNGFVWGDGTTPGRGGGAILCDSGTSPTIANCLIENCESSNFVAPYPQGCGGAICCDSGYPLIIGCLMRDNYAEGRGGAIMIYGGPPSPPGVVNCLIMNNTAGTTGGGIHVWGGGSDVDIINSTIVDNYAASSGGGLYLNFSADANVVNSIIWYNSAPVGEEINVRYNAGVLDIGYTCVQPGRVNHEDSPPPTSVINWGSGNTSAEPEFASGLTDNYRLRHTSVCIDAGNNFSIPIESVVDLDRRLRVINSTVDMGAYEFRGLYVPSGIYPTIQSAIDAAAEYDTVVVADGTYSGLGNRDLDFGGKSIVVSSQNGPWSCTIDCQFLGSGFSFMNGEGSDAVVDGFLITNGQPMVTPAAGGISCFAGSWPTITDCIITGNQTGMYGGGIYCEQASPILIDCDINSNTADLGGGLYLWLSNPSMVNCKITSNTASGASGYGGGMYCASSTPLLINCDIVDNWADNGGGGVCCYNSATPVFINSLINYNGTGGTGAGIYCYSNCNATLAGCTIAGNWASGNAGGIYCYDNVLTFSNSIVWDNTASGSGHQIMKAGVSQLNFNYSCYSNGLNDVMGGGTLNTLGCITSDPYFVFPDGGNYRLHTGSPCINTGSNAYVPGGISFDLDGKPRIVNGTVDMGPYEYRALMSSDYGSIQEAIDAAVDGDTVVVLNGMYTGASNRDLELRGKLIHLHSVSGAPFCILDCQAAGRGFYIHEGEGSGTVIEGFYIWGGWGGDGAGILTDGTSPTIKDCVISNCTTGGYGGGIAVKQGDPMLVNCLIEGNSGGNYGGGIYAWSSYLALKNCTLSNNSANNGGGISCMGGANVYAIDTIFWNNAAASGDEIYSYQNGAIDLYYCCYANQAGDIGSNDGTPDVTEIGGCFYLDPWFVAGPYGMYYLSQVAAGQGSNSPCLNAGSIDVFEAGLDDKTTRTDSVFDTGWVDVGYHYDP